MGIPACTLPAGIKANRPTERRARGPGAARMTLERSLWPPLADRRHDAKITVCPRVALVGCGRRFTSVIAPALKAMGVAVVLIVDPDPAARQRVMTSFHCDDMTVLASRLTSQILVRVLPNAVIVSSPSGLHFRHAQISLSCGLPTFVEKPLACASEHARILQQTRDSHVSTSEQRIHRQDLKVVRSLIESGSLGRLRYIEYQDSVTPAPHFSTTWRNDPALAGGGILLDLGYHTIGALHWLLGTSSEDFNVTHAHLRHGRLRVEQHAEVECTSGDIDISLDIRLDENRPREVLMIQGSLAQVRLERERKKPAVALITLREGAGNLTIRPVKLTADYDTRSLRDFFSGNFHAYHLNRHVRTLEFLEMVYARSGGRASQCS